MTEYGLFNDEGLVEGQFYKISEAVKTNARRYSPEDELYVAEICPDHDEQPRDNCEECNEEVSE